MLEHHWSSPGSTSGRMIVTVEPESTSVHTDLLLIPDHTRETLGPEWGNAGPPSVTQLFLAGECMEGAWPGVE